ncbi:MAG: GxxExxY protein [Spirochaetales bacterium]|nr:GxxExxY protein [Spirochaetales bacterium]
MIYKELAFEVVGCCLKVHSQLGPGLLEQCYHNALFYELKGMGFLTGYNVPFNVSYKGNIVGEYFADLVVENKIIIELKSAKCFSEAHIAQLINYLHISGCRLGILVNFQGSYLEWRRIVI